MKEENKTLATPFNLARAAIEKRIVEYFCTPNKDTYVVIKTNFRDETFSTNSRDLRDCMAIIAFEEVDGLLIDDRLLDMLERLLHVRALASRSTKRVWVRTARTEEGIEIDLNNEKGECVLVTPDNWEITLPKSRFLRSRNMGAIAYPMEGADEQVFLPYFRTLSHDEFMLMVAWTLFSFWPSGPYPILNVKGQRGSGKSTTSEFIKTVSDPVAMGQRRLPPDTPEQLFVAAKWCKLFVADNASSLNAKMSDAYCCLSTGAALGKRKQYSNDDEHLIDQCNPVIMNGITDIASRQDLLSRFLIVELASGKEIDEGQLRPAFEKDLPSMFGYLLNGLASALKNLPETLAPSGTRLVDFARVVTAAEEGLGWEKGSFMQALIDNQQSSATDAMTLHPLIRAILALFRDHKQEEWQGTIQTLRDKLDRYAGNDKLTPAWPKTAQHMSRELDRLKADMPKVGLEFEKLQRTGNKKPIVLRYKGTLDAIDREEPVFDE